MSQIVDNERAKVTANWLNAIAAGVMTAGAVTPLVALGLGLLGPEANGFAVAGIAALCLVASVALHLAGRFVLRRLT